MGSLCTPHLHPSSQGTAGDRRGGRHGPPARPSPSPQQTHVPTTFFLWKSVSEGERDRQKLGALAPLCYDTSTSCSVVAPSPVRTSVLPPRISCPHPGQPPRPRPRPCGAGGAGEALPAGDDSELLFTYLAAALPAGLLPVRPPESRARPRSRSLLLRPHTPSPSAAPASPGPQPFPREATQVPVLL